MVNSAFKNFIGKKAKNMIGKTDFEVQGQLQAKRQHTCQIINNYIVLMVIYFLKR